MAEPTGQGLIRCSRPARLLLALTLLPALAVAQPPGTEPDARGDTPATATNQRADADDDRPDLGNDSEGDDGEAVDEWSDEGWNDDLSDDGWEDDWDSEWDEESTSAWYGFSELAGGFRIVDQDAVDQQATLAEARWRIERQWTGEFFSAEFRADLLGDAVLKDVTAELRELFGAWRLGSVDLKAGRQILTWGTGDFLFLNDLFPKGWVSFFIGRDDEYLKAPSDAVRFTQYNDVINLDLVGTFRFNPDEYLTGERLSFFSPAAGSIVAPDPPLVGREPSASLDNAEWSLRLFRTLGSGELAFYGFDGFYHQPSPSGPNGALEFPRLQALGASWRQPLGPGLFNIEVARYYSVDDRSGTDPFVPNDQERYLLGYEWEAVPNLTVGFQAYLEWTRDHDALLENSPWPQFEVEERRTWLTNRLTWRTRQDRVIWSLFTFYGPTDRDFYLRPQVNWRISDEWSVAAGGNFFGGSDPWTFFAQFEDNSNLYARMRFSY